jgi:hypothetical protein
MMINDLRQEAGDQQLTKKQRKKKRRRESASLLSRMAEVRLITDH